MSIITGERFITDLPQGVNAVVCGKLIVPLKECLNCPVLKNDRCPCFKEKIEGPAKGEIIFREYQTVEGVHLVRYN